MSLLENIIAKGNRSLDLQTILAGGGNSANWITCADGFKLSVIAGGGAYCQPRPGDPPEWGGVPDDYPGPYTAVEVGYPSGPVPGTWHDYCDGAEPTCVATISPVEDCTCGGVFGCVPVGLVRDLVALHGGEQP